MDIKERLQKAREFVSLHHSECAKDLCEWRDTGILKKDCHVRHLSEILKPIDSANSLDLARKIVVDQALDLMARSAD